MNCLNAYAITKLRYPNWDMRIYATIDHEKIPFSVEEYGLKADELLVKPLKDADACLLFDVKTGRALSPEMSDAECAQLGERYRQLATSKLSDLSNKIDAFAQFSDKADLVISVSAIAAPPRLSKFNSDDSKYIYFFEYGTYPEDSEKNSFCMGVGPYSCGIYILNPEVPERFTNPILQRLSDSNTRFYFNYGWDIQGYASLIDRLNSDAKEIHIVTNAPVSAIKKMSIRNCTLSFVDKDGIETVVVSPEHSEKKICFINAFPLDHGDMLRAIKMSQEPVGITGNNTFSETLAFDKLPFYNNRECLQSFWVQLIGLAEKALPQHVLLISYLRQMSYKSGLKVNHIGERGQNSDVQIKADDLVKLQQQWADLVKILREDWDVKNAYLGEINRRIALQTKMEAVVS